MQITAQNKKNNSWISYILLVGILLIGGYFRFKGINWGELNIQHPDENFFTSVTYDIKPVHSLAEYFDTANSTLNPANEGHAFYVYGTLPIFIVRGLWDLTNQLGNIRLFGRQISALADLLSVLLLFFIAKRIYGARVGLLAALFSSLVVMQIQQSHFYTSDNFSTFFMMLTIYFTVLIAKEPKNEISQKQQTNHEFQVWVSRIFRDRIIWLSAAFGLSVGMAIASKLNSAPMVVLLPIALVIRYFQNDNTWGGSSPSARIKFSLEVFLGKNLIYIVAGALFTIISFRIFQPYAFSGLWFDSQWLKGIQDLRAQASPNADMPWSLQWARRTHLFSLKNLSIWGLGIPLSILAWGGFLLMGWRILKGEWKTHALLWLWTGGYFVWQSLQYNATMRYQLPIYPLLAMMAAWLVFWLWDQGKKAVGGKHPAWIYCAISLSLGILGVVLTAGWAYAFSQIYVNPEPRIAASNWIYQNIAGPINLEIQLSDGTNYQQPLPFVNGTVIQSDLPYTTVFIPQKTGILESILLEHVKDTTYSGRLTLSITLSSIPDPSVGEKLTTGSVASNFPSSTDARGNSFTISFDNPVSVESGTTYYLTFQTTGGSLEISGSNLTNETDFDYGLPFRTSGYDGFGGIYRGDLNLQVYWDDNADKLARFESILDQTDYILIPTNHQYGQITRIPERYPLTTEYYRELLGCPADKDIISCYYAAEPGMFQGNLGFDLVATFKDYPTIGPIVINDQAAEEAFTFYDHPKVLIFKKNSTYSSAKVQAILGTVDLSTVVHLTPAQADKYKSLMLSTQDLAQQRAGGTWSDLFDRDAFYNKYPGLGAVVWYLVILFLGLVTYPIVRAGFPGLSDKGYPLSRMVGLLLWAWLAWMAGSIGLSYSKLSIGISLIVITLLGVWQAWRQRAELVEEFKKQWKYYLLVEMVFLSFFMLDLFIRLGNSDLWHPSKGGERPMDFAYFNAILKSTSFPPYDPWYAGGYINYYYYGYVIVGTPVKLLGIVPSIAYNYILPTLFSCLAICAFSIGWNILARKQTSSDEPKYPSIKPFSVTSSRLQFIAGISAAAAMVLLGNLGVVRMIYQGLQQIAANGLPLEHANFIQHIWLAIKGFYMTLTQGAHLTFGPGDWYWFPSRALPDSSGNPITEFPLFTFLYSDLHAHMISLPITTLAVAWGISVLKSKVRWKSLLDGAIVLFLGGLIIGALKPTNTWDFYTYIILGSAIVIYTVWRYADIGFFHINSPNWIKRVLLTVGAMVALVITALVLYQPFTKWFLLDPGYTRVFSWTGGRSNISSYLVHWGVFLFVIISWMTWETHKWLDETPVSALNKLKPYKALILVAAVLIVMILIIQQVWVMSPSQNVPFHGITILWLAVPLGVWAGILIFKASMPDVKRLVLFMVGTSLLLTMIVELIVMGGDIGRMNTVFKLYNQAWVLLAICAAAAFCWLLVEIPKWLPGWQAAWQISATLLIAGTFLFLFMGGMGKIRDRMATDAPRTLDSMTFMDFAYYFEGFGTASANMDLSQDYRAIRWMQDNIQGSPVIAEAPSAGVQYTWLNRFSIYTGLPDVVGWEWHQVQQRVMFAASVINRGRVEEDGFYNTMDINEAIKFLQKYDVKYIVVGQLERLKYTPTSLDTPNGLYKFEEYKGTFWNEVYREGETVIYEVKHLVGGSQ